MVKKLIVRVKTGEETNKASRSSKTFLSSDTTMFRQDRYRPSIKIKQKTKQKKGVMFLYSQLK